MAGKVLLGLVAALAVTGGAVMYSGGSGYKCPFSGTGDASCAASEVTSCAADTDVPACCAVASRAKMVCCEDAAETTGGGDGVAALTGGLAMGR